MLVNTSLTQVSVAFKNLLNLQHLNLEDSAIDCTCDLTWMKYWMTDCATRLSVSVSLGFNVILVKVLHVSIQCNLKLMFCLYVLEWFPGLE